MTQLKNELAWQRPTLTKGNPSLPSALRSLTTVFGMGTGVTFLPSSPHNFHFVSFLHINATGLAGFEPTREGVKVPCLTAWL